MTRAQMRAAWRQRDRKIQPYERKYIRQFRKALNEQIKPVLTRLENVTTPQDIIADIPNLVSSKPLEVVYERLHKEVGLEFLMDAARNLKSQYAILETKNEQADQVDEFISLWQLVVAEYIQQNKFRDISTITATSRDQAIAIIRRLIDEGVDQGLSIQEIKRNMLKEIPKEWRKKRFRAEVIARTEVGKAAEHGNHVGAEATGLQYDKVWLARLDGRERPSHRAIHGERVDLKQNFSNGLLHPKDERGAAEEIINCRCAAVHVRPGRGIEGVPNR